MSNMKSTPCGEGKQIGENRHMRSAALRSQSATRAIVKQDEKILTNLKSSPKRGSVKKVPTTPSRTPKKKNLPRTKSETSFPVIESVLSPRGRRYKIRPIVIKVHFFKVEKKNAQQKTPSKNRRAIEDEKLGETPSKNLTKQFGELTLKSDSKMYYLRQTPQRKLFGSSENIQQLSTSPSRVYNTRSKTPHKKIDFSPLQKDDQDPSYIDVDESNESTCESEASITTLESPDKPKVTQRRSRGRPTHRTDSDSCDSDKENKPKRGRSRSASRTRKAATLKLKTLKASKVLNFDETNLSPLELVKKALHTSYIPEHLLKREKEYEEIRGFFESCIEKDAESQALYISGVPGTGKTATVLKVKTDLGSMSINNFIFVHVNGLEVTDPKSIFISVYQQVTDDYKKISSNNARQKLNAMFSVAENNRLPVIMLVDELDMLLTKRQEIIYDIFNWTALPEARINVIAISNTLDLPERMLNHRISSRLGSNRISFQPYDYNEIAEIINHRISGCKAISSDAVQLASRKVAALSGDLRKALDIMRRGVEIAMDGDIEEMTMEHVQKAMKEASSSIRMDFFRSISKHQLMLMRAVVQDQLKSGLEESTFFQVFEEYKPLCLGEGMSPLSMSKAWSSVLFLYRCHLLVLGSGVGDVDRKLRLGMSLVEVQFCLNMLKNSQVE